MSSHTCKHFFLRESRLFSGSGSDGRSRHLEHALKECVTETLRINFTTLDNLAETVGKMEKAYERSKQGLWHRLWYGLGNNKEVIDAWMGLIPDQYGLSVIKAGLAVVFKVGWFHLAVRFCQHVVHRLSVLF